MTMATCVVLPTMFQSEYFSVKRYDYAVHLRCPELLSIFFLYIVSFLPPFFFGKGESEKTKVGKRPTRPNDLRLDKVSARARPVERETVFSRRS